MNWLYRMEKKEKQVGKENSMTNFPVAASVRFTCTGFSANKNINRVIIYDVYVNVCVSLSRNHKKHNQENEIEE